MIFSLPPALIKTTERIIHNDKSVAYGWGNVDALNKWLISMDKKAIDRAIGTDTKNKYPLIWLEENWEAEEVISGYKFTRVSFWISANSDVATLNENRDFTTQYKVANDLIDQLKLVLTVGKDSISWVEKSNVSTNKKSPQLDVWDSVIITLDLIINKNCTKKLYV